MTTTVSRTAGATTAAIAAAALIPGVVAGLPASHAVRHAAAPAPTGVRTRARAATLRPGKWIRVGASFTDLSGTPTVWQGAGTAYMLWLRRVSASKQTYEVVKVSGAGKVSAPIDIYSGAHWASLSPEPTLLPHGKKPIVIFDGQNPANPPYDTSCVFGAVGGATPWTLQDWSLSNDCANPVGAAAENKSGTLAAAFPGGWTTGHGVLYRIGTSSTIPATGADKHIGLAGSANANKVAMAADTGGNDHFYVAWAQGSSAKRDGYYVKDVTAKTKTMKMPGTGTNTIIHLQTFTNLAMTTRAHGGVYLAGCANGAVCKLQLWRAGAKKAVKAPSSPAVFSVSISQGPAGRIWMASYDDNSQKVSITRSNKRATRFGPVQAIATPCAFGGLLGLSGGPSGRLIVGLSCPNKKNAALSTYVTESRAKLMLASNRSSVPKGRKVVFTVRDAGDPVAGAKVTFEGHRATTNAKGKAVIKATKKGKATATATAAGYAGARRKVTVT